MFVKNETAQLEHEVRSTPGGDGGKGDAELSCIDTRHTMLGETSWVRSTHMSRTSALSRLAFRLRFQLYSPLSQPMASVDLCFAYVIGR